MIRYRVRGLIEFTSCRFQPWHGNTADLLGSVLSLLLLLPAHLGLGLHHALADQSVFGPELLGEVHGVIDKSEAGGLAASEVGLEAEDEDPVGGAVVHLAELFPDVSLADGRLAGVEDVHNHLPPAEQSVQHVFAGPDGHTAVNHGDFSCRSESSNISL